MTLFSKTKRGRGPPYFISTSSFKRCLLFLGAACFLLAFATINVMIHQTSSSILVHPQWFKDQHNLLDLHNTLQKESHQIAKSQQNKGDPISGKERLVEILNTMNFTDMIAEETWKAIPPWSRISRLYGSEPIVVGMDRCEEFRENVSEENRLIGPAGLFNTGTNLLAELLKRNCVMEARQKKMGKRRDGMIWQVPWGKHTPLDLSNHTIQQPEYQRINKDHVLPVMTIREPYEWFNSMCHNNYVARWPHQHRCPNLIFPNQTFVTVMMQYFHGSIKQYHKTLAHLWNDWNRQYFAENFTRPRLVVRHKDLIFYPKELTKLVCGCAGGVFKDQDFSYVMESAKPNRKGAKPFDGLVGNWIKYGKEFDATIFPEEDLRIAKDVLDQDIMDQFGFKGP